MLMTPAQLRLIPNFRGLEKVATGTFGGAAMGLSGVDNATFDRAKTVIDLTMRDNVPRPLIITLISPNPLTPLGSFGVNPFYAQLGCPSVYAQWGSGGYNTYVIFDGREGDVFSVSCSHLRLGIFNDAISQGYDPALATNGVKNSIDFGALAALGRTSNHLKRTINYFTAIAPTASKAFNIPKYATRVKVYSNPNAPMKVYLHNSYGAATRPQNTVHEILAGADCPWLELHADTNAVFVEAGITQIERTTLVFELAL